MGNGFRNLINVFLVCSKNKLIGKPFFFVPLMIHCLSTSHASSVREAFNNKILSKEEFTTAMIPPQDELQVPVRFYCTFKVHKKHEHRIASSPRGIVSCSGTLTENIAVFLVKKIFLKKQDRIIKHL